MLASIAPQAALEEENSICVALGAGVGAGVLVSRYFGVPNYVKMKTIVTAAGQTIVSPKTASTLLFFAPPHLFRALLPSQSSACHLHCSSRPERLLS